MSPETFWLVAWSLGGLLVMSIVPSKRIDRVFPIVPPLCLLLAAQVAEFRRSEKSKALTARCCTIAIIFACLFTTGYAAGKIVLGYRQHSDAFAAFGTAVREEAAAQGWNYEVVGGEDEGMALYLRRTPNSSSRRRRWLNGSGGKLDGLVVPDDELTGLLPRLPGAVPSRIGSSEPAGRSSEALCLSGAIP